jgi:hypothetical protein
MGKTNKQLRSLEDKQHHVARAIKKEVTDRSVRNIDRALKNKRYEQFYDELDNQREEEYHDER